MSVTIKFPMDELQLDDLIANSWTTLKLYYSNTPEGPYVDTTVSPDMTLSEANTIGAPHLFTFSCLNQNPAQWFKVVAYNGITVSPLTDSQPFHGGGGTTLQAIRQKVGLFTSTMKIGTTTSTGASNGSTAINTEAKFKRFRDNYFGGVTGVDGWFFNNLSTNQWTVCSGWTQSSGTFTLAPALSAQVGSGVNFEVMARWTPDEYRTAINWAITYAYPYLSKTVIDISTRTEEDIFEYTIPYNIRILNKVEIEDTTFSSSTDSRTRSHPWRQISFSPLEDGTDRKIEFKVELASDRRLRFTGTTLLSLLYNDSDYVELFDPQIDLLVYLTAYRLYSSLENTDPSSDINRFDSLAQKYLQMWEVNKTKKSVRRKAKKIWQHDALWSNY